MGEKAAESAWQYGAVGVAALVFAVAVVILWRYLIAREDKISVERETMVKERASWELQEVKIRKECSETISVVQKQCADQVSALQKQQIDQVVALQLAAQKREDDQRKDFADMMEMVETKGAEANAAVAAVMQKFYERFVGPRPRGY